MTDIKQRNLALIFGMVLIASLSVMFLFNEGIEGKAIQEFNSAKEKNTYCEELCDEEMQKDSPEYSNWISCHEKCFK